MTEITTTHTMPMLTDSEREEAIKHAKALMRPDSKGRTTLIAQIALAALTAESVHQFILNNPDHDGYIKWADCNPDFYSKESSDNRRILYTAPPVPALKLPKELTWSYHDNISRVEVESWNSCLAEVKRLNGVTE